MYFAFACLGGNDPFVTASNPFFGSAVFGYCVCVVVYLGLRLRLRLKLRH